MSYQPILRNSKKIFITKLAVIILTEDEQEPIGSRI